MKAKRFTAEQIVQILRAAESGEQSIGEVCRKHGITDVTRFAYRWRQRYHGLTISDAKRLRDLSAANTRLKKLLAERDLEGDALKQLVGKKWSARRSGVRPFRR